MVRTLAGREWGSQSAALGSAARDHHRADVTRAAKLEVVAERNDVAEHLFEVAGDRDLLDRVRDLSVLNPETRSAARVIAGHRIDTLAKLLGHEQPPPHPAQQRGEVLGTRDDEVV